MRPRKELFIKATITAVFRSEEETAALRFMAIDYVYGHYISDRTAALSLSHSVNAIFEWLLVKKERAE